MINDIHHNKRKKKYTFTEIFLNIGYLKDPVTSAYSVS